MLNAVATAAAVLRRLAHLGLQFLSHSLEDDDEGCADRCDGAEGSRESRVDRRVEKLNVTRLVVQADASC